MTKKNIEPTQAEYDEIRDIYAMFRHLGQSYDALDDKSSISDTNIRFSGFDAHTDAKQLSAARQLQRIDKSIEVFDSHGERMSGYRKSLQRWKAVKSDQPLTKDQIIRIISG